LFQLNSIIRPHLLAMTPYSSARDEYTGTEGVFLDANENPLGSATETDFNRYPDPYQWAVKEVIGRIKGAKPKQIFLGNGSDEAIDLLIRATCEPQQDSILILPPTYGMYQVCADIQNISTIKVPLSVDFELEPERVLAAVQPHTKLIWICSPNNPSGNTISRMAILQILENFQQGLVVIDEAYIDFASEPSFIEMLDNYPNLVVLQTFSKAWGLAGLRLGMAFGSEALIQVLNKIKYPYNINVLTQQTLLEALKNEEKKNTMVAEIIAERSILAEKLSQIAIVKHIFPSDSNMLLVKFDEPKQLFDALIAQKIIVRDRSKVQLCEGCLRISVGTAAENQTLIDAIGQIATEG
jgi:histidinol-phosphate aminotransferase